MYNRAFVKRVVKNNTTDEAKNINTEVVTTPSNTYYTSQFDLIGIQSLNNRDRINFEEVILGNQVGSCGVNSEGIKMPVTKYSDIVDLRILDLGTINGDRKSPDIHPMYHKKHLSPAKIARVISNHNHYLKVDRDDISLGGAGLSTLVGISPFNKTGFDSPFTSENGLLEETLNNNDHVQLPVAKSFREKESLIKESDSCKYIFFTSDVYNVTSIEDCSNQDSFTYYSKRGDEINGAKYWYKDTDNLPSVIRPMNLNSLITTVCDCAFEPDLTPYSKNYNGTIYSYKNYEKIRKDIDLRNGQDSLTRNSQIYSRLTKALSNKIIVIEHKRINTTVSLNNKGRLEITCPIVKSYVDNGYILSNPDSDVYRTMMKTFSMDLVDSFIPKFTPLTDPRLTYAMTAYGLGSGFMFNRDSNYYKGYGVPNRTSLCLSQIMSKAQQGIYSSTGVFMEEFNTNPGNLISSGIPSLPMLKPTDSYTLMPYRYRKGEDDYIDNDFFTLSKYEVPTIWVPEQGGNNCYNLGVEVNISLSLVKHIIIDITSPEFMTGDVVYDKSSNLLIGKIYRDEKETLELIGNNFHPMTLKEDINNTDGISYSYIRRQGSKLPKKIYINTTGVVEKVKSSYGNVKEGLYVYKNGMVNKYIPFDQFGYYGIFNTHKEAEDYTSYGEHYKIGINNCLRDKNIENQIALADNARTNLSYERARTDMKLELLNKEISYKEAEMEVKTMAINLAKLKAELELVQLSIKSEDTKIEQQTQTMKAVKSGLDLINLISKGADLLFRK